MKGFTQNKVLRIMRRIVLILLLLFFVFILFFNKYIKEKLDEDIKNDLINDSMIVSKEVDKYFTKYEEVVRQMSTNDKIIDFIKTVNETGDAKGHPDYITIMDTLNRIKETDSEIGYVWLGINAINDLVTHNPDWVQGEDFVITERPWYKELLRSEIYPIHTNPYVGSGTEKHIISIAAPVFSGSEIIGSVAIDIDISKINAFVNNYQVGEEGYSFLMTQENNLVLSFDSQDELEDEFDNFLSEMIEASREGIMLYEYEGEEKFIATTTVDINNWRVASVVPKSETQELISAFNTMSWIIMIAFIVISIVFEVIYRLSTNLEKLNALYALLKEQEEQIKKIAYIDPLTEIPNRRNFIETLEKSIKADQSGGVFLLDIDNFKEINDTFGHVYGDEVLKEVSRLLKQIESDQVFISRFGGDEFLIQMNNTTSDKELNQVIEALSNLFEDPIKVESEALFVSVSMGVTRYPRDSRNVNDLIMNADIAMYHVKNHGKNNHIYYDKHMMNDLKEKAFIEKTLRQVLVDNNLRLVYQPQIDTLSGEVMGYEALVRMPDNAISPAKFIPVAEETGMIVDIGRRVTKEVVLELANLKRNGITPKTISINFSVKQIRDIGYIEYLKDLLLKHSVEAEYIDIEITESVMVENQEETLKYLKGLKDIGVSISLDDFGTGYSSLNYLTYLPVDKIKLDKSLSDKFLLNEKNTVILNIIALAHSLSLKVTAEGIESQDQYETLKGVKCDYIQGYYFDKPLEKDEFEKQFNKSYSDLC